MNIMSALRFLFYPNPSGGSYASPWAIGVYLLVIALIALSLGLRRWRARTADARQRKLSQGWSRACVWFAIVPLLLLASRVERIQYFAMRFLWVVYAVVAVLYVVAQVRIWKTKYYQILPNETVADPRDKYIPGKKR